MADDFRILLMSEEDQLILGELDGGEISPKVWQHAEHPQHMGKLADPDGQAEVTGICEDTIAFQLRLSGKSIDEICFSAHGCGFTVACGSIVTELVAQMSLGDALGLTGRQIEQALGGLPRGHMHCADLAASALKAAIQNALENLRDPWRRVYRSKI